MLRGGLKALLPPGHSIPAHRTLSSRTYSDLIIRDLVDDLIRDLSCDLMTRDLMTCTCSVYALIIIISTRIRSAHMLSISDLPPMKFA